MTGRGGVAGARRGPAGGALPRHPVAAGVAAAVAARDPRRLAPAFTATARLRALLPGGAVEARGREDVAAFLPSLLADFDAVEVLDSAGEDVGDLLLVHYRLGVRRGARRWVCTQTAVCTVVDGRLAVVDLLCSGFRDPDGDADRGHGPGVTALPALLGSPG